MFDLVSDLEAAGEVSGRFESAKPLEFFDTRNLMIYYHTDDNRTVRSIDMKKIDWGNLKGGKSMQLRTTDIPAVQEVTPII